MVDNVKVDPGTGGGSPLVAADDVGGGVVVQRVKLMLGADGVNDGDVSSSNPVPVSLAAGAATAAKQDTGNTSIGNVDTNLGAKADTAATDDGASAWSLIALFKRLLGKFAALATSAKQDTGNASLASIDGKITAVNTGAVTVAGSALPTGAATSANQATEITSLSNIDADLGAKADAAASTDAGTFSLIALFKRLLGKITAVDTGNVTVAASALPSGGASAANQATMMSSLTQLVSGIIINDLPVVMRQLFLQSLNDQIACEANGGRLRVVLDAGPGAQTLGTVTTVGTCSTVTNVSNVAALGPASAGIPIRDALITPTERGAWANTVRARIT